MYVACEFECSLLMVDVRATVGERTNRDNFDYSTVENIFLQKNKQKSRISGLRGMKMMLCLLVLLWKNLEENHSILY